MQNIQSVSFQEILAKYIKIGSAYTLKKTLSSVSPTQNLTKDKSMGSKKNDQWICAGVSNGREKSIKNNIDLKISEDELDFWTMNFKNKN